MPPKEIQNGNLYMSFGDGEYHKIGSSISTIEPPEIEDKIEKKISQTHEVSFLMSDLKSVVGLNLAEMWLVFIGIYTYEQITSNNWRRLHGLPMKHRRRIKNVGERNSDFNRGKI